VREFCFHMVVAFQQCDRTIETVESSATGLL
jgi:hypothetical protein